MSEKESIPIDSRYRTFSSKPVSLGGMTFSLKTGGMTFSLKTVSLGGRVCFGHRHFITCNTAEAQEISSS